ncbi:hypothetical protein QBC42DRAFT_29822 [Cladorrhinum samala]|uniref:NADH dehydrogenase subunit 1 n=1 Tax=Cladorrhinum samala TaxID=585594 RepID=A0AAV9HEL2_9PEZI|nr:hypothetical protein QBC42DRAFT_29822 [Cladorrhinum samala]
MSSNFYFDSFLFFFFFLFYFFPFSFSSFFFGLLARRGVAQEWRWRWRWRFLFDGYAPRVSPYTYCGISFTFFLVPFLCSVICLIRLFLFKPLLFLGAARSKTVSLFLCLPLLLLALLNFTYFKMGNLTTLRSLGNGRE